MFAPPVYQSLQMSFIWDKKRDAPIHGMGMQLLLQWVGPSPAEEESGDYSYLSLLSV